MPLRLGAAGVEDVALGEALGRVLAEDVSADLELPPFDRSMMDGYAVRAADVARAPVRLRVAGSVRAGLASATSVRFVRRLSDRQKRRELAQVADLWRHDEACLRALFEAYAAQWEVDAPPGRDG